MTEFLELCHGPLHQWEPQGLYLSSLRSGNWCSVCAGSPACLAKEAATVRGVHMNEYVNLSGLFGLERTMTCLPSPFLQFFFSWSSFPLVPFLWQHNIWPISLFVGKRVYQNDISLSRFFSLLIPSVIYSTFVFYLHLSLSLSLSLFLCLAGCSILAVRWLFPRLETINVNDVFLLSWKARVWLRLRNLVTQTAFILHLSFSQV